MTIGDSVKKVINNAFVNTIFMERTPKALHEAFSKNVDGSNNISILPSINNMYLEYIDENHDKVAFLYDDYVFDGIITWRKSTNNLNYVFQSIK